MDMKDAENEVLQDFKNALNKLNFQAYNPSSTEFLSALVTGEMWRLIKQLNSLDGSEYESKTLVENKTDEESVEKDDISEEISGAKKYFQKSIECGDGNFKSIAMDKLRCAEMLIKKAYSKLPGSEEKLKLKDYEEQIKNISEQM